MSTGPWEAALLLQNHPSSLNLRSTWYSRLRPLVYGVETILSQSPEFLILRHESVLNGTARGDYHECRYVKYLRHRFSTFVARQQALYPTARSLLLFLSCILVACLFMPNAIAQTAYTVSISVVGLPSTLTTNVYVDGALNGTMRGGQTRSFTFSASANFHSITVDFYVPNSAGANGTRYFVKEASWSFSSAGSNVFTYTAQYYLALQTPYSSASGQGWYDSGSVAHANVRDSEVDEGQGTRQVFAGWTRDASGTALTSKDIIMNGPKTAVATWKTQFYLTVESDPPNITGLNGSGWYDTGNQASFSAAAIIAASDNTRLEFDHWGGDYAGQSTTGTILMDRPKTVRASYFAQYLLVVQYDPTSTSSEYNESHAGWYTANSNVQLGPAPSTINLSSVERLRFLGWIDNGSPNPSPSYTVLMDQPRTITLSYMTQYYVDVRSSQGTASGSSWYDRGSAAKITATVASQTWPFSYTFTGWKLDPSTGRLTKTDDSWELTVDGPYVVEAQWSFDYLPVVMVFGGGGLAVAVLAGAIGLAHRRGILKRERTTFRPMKPGSMAPGTIAVQVCSNCGNRAPIGATFCQKCGASLQAPTVTPTAPAVPSLDDRVYDYIVKHEGVISLSAASADLGILVEELKEITERLKKQGRLA